MYDRASNEWPNGLVCIAWRCAEHRRKSEREYRCGYTSREAQAAVVETAESQGIGDVEAAKALLEQSERSGERSEAVACKVAYVNPVRFALISESG